MNTIKTQSLIFSILICFIQPALSQSWSLNKVIQTALKKSLNQQIIQEKN